MLLKYRLDQNVRSRVDHQSSHILSTTYMGINRLKELQSDRLSASYRQSRMSMHKRSSSMNISQMFVTSLKHSQLRNKSPDNPIVRESIQNILVIDDDSSLDRDNEVNSLSEHDDSFERDNNAILTQFDP